ncbi:pyridine nucleotide-disulfide oxidoreductase domain-containing protein [Ditylenchus destructor]|uniref:Pyridine nucleotide-disulfide oxidoreductase domain-containing protein n=1 Tax=Ditylenchus destructor TaxID=166010 RepID=A0AAD4N3T9_9BILA|nr:pyridine nucleotide-disulfide oxidoreductase domain-containing protein [Ditylenchus destructor]
MTKKLVLDTEVVVIGNGPAGLSFSTFLSGWQPFYNSNRPHPDPVVHQHLAQSPNTSLLEQDLSWFQDECAERLNPSTGAYAGLYDTLVRPPLDDTKTCLRWKRDSKKTIPHIILGDSEIGGSWNNYDDDMVTVSLASWMDLPGYSLSQWLGGESALSRLPAAIIREYMKDYAKHMQIDANFKPFTKVTNVMKWCDHCTGEEYWAVEFIDKKTDCTFTLKCRNVVLACGQSHHRMLEVPGELSESNVVYDVSSMKQLLDSSGQTGVLDKEQTQLPVLVIGDGISAADAVLWCLSNSVPVIQIIRRSDKQLRNIMISRLSPTVYPEYAKMYRLMMRKDSNSNYQCLTSTQVISFDNETDIVSLQTSQGVIQEKFKCVVVCVGRQANLDMLEDKFEFLANYQSSSDKTLFAIGSLAGDHFVRYLIGGAMHVAQNLILSHNKRREIYNEENKTPLISSQSAPSRTFNQSRCKSCFLLKYIIDDNQRQDKQKSQEPYNVICYYDCYHRPQQSTMIAE